MPRMSRGHQPGLLFALREGDGIDYAFIMFPSLIEDSWGEYGQRTGFAKVSGLRERIWLSSDVFIGRPLTGQLLREHLLQVRGRHRIQDEDRPKQTPLTTLQLLARADRAGAQRSEERRVGKECRS